MYCEHLSCRSPGYDLWNWSLLLDSIHVIENQGLRMNLSKITDFRSLFDNLSKTTNIASYVDDKKTAIDLTILKNDLQHTGGQLRWVTGEIIISDALTKKGPISFLRGIMKLAY